MKDPAPQGRYLPAKRFSDLVFTSGMTPRQDGVLSAVGKVGVREPLETHKDAVVLATSNALAAARNRTGEDEAIAEILSLSVFVAAEPGFQAHARIADFASDYLYAELGDAGVGARTAIGVASLPGDASVEVQLVAVVSRKSETQRA